MISEDPSSLFESDPNVPAPVSLRQGVVESWDPETGENSIQIAGGTLVNLPALTSESASLTAGDVVALLTDGSKWLLVGKVTTPGDPGTVPSWVGDISALAPLTDLAAVTEGLVITGATNETAETGSGPRVVINDPAYPGEIVLYTASPDEIEPARIRPIVNSGAAYLQIISPKTSIPDAPTTLDLNSDDGLSSFAIDADVQHLFATNMTIDGFSSLKLGDGSDYIDVVGDALQNADLSSPTNVFPGIPYSVVASGTTDANGFLTITHGAGFTPVGGWWVCTNPSSSPAQFWGIDTIGATTVRLRFASVFANAALASTAVQGRLFLVRP